MEYRLHAKIAALQRQINALKQIGQVDAARLVDDQAQRAALAVLAHVDHAARKRPIVHAGHGDEKVVRQIDGLRVIGHGPILAGHGLAVAGCQAVAPAVAARA